MQYTYGSTEILFMAKRLIVERGYQGLGIFEILLEKRCNDSGTLQDDGISRLTYGEIAM